nr:hypothetical protein [Tissierella sp.]
MKALLDIAHSNLRDTIKHRIINISGGKIYETDDYMLFTIGIDTSDGHLNGCLQFNDEAFEETFNSAQEFFKDLEFSYSFWIREGIDQNLEKLLLDLGHEPKRRPGSSIMVIEEQIENASLPEDYLLKSVETDEDIKNFCQVIEKSFDKDPFTVKTMFESRDNLISNNLKSFIIYNKDQDPVSAAITSITKDSAGIYYIGTVEEERSKGLGKAIVKSSTNIGFDQGKDLVVLQASELGEIVYNQLGFKKIGTYLSFGMER